MYFGIINKIENVETTAIGGNIRDIMQPRKQYDIGLWRKMKGVADIRLQSGSTRKTELHWYEAHGIGRKKMKLNGYDIKAGPKFEPALTFSRSG